MDPENRALIEKTGVSIWLKVSFAKLSDRVRIDGSRPNFMNLDQARQLYHSREPSYALAKMQISTDEGTPETIADEIIGVIRNS